MTKLPVFTGKVVVEALKRPGFKVLRIKGSHYFMQHSDGRATVVPVHNGETLGPGLLSKILRDCGISKDDLLMLL